MGTAVKKLKKELCSICHDRGFIEYEKGLVQRVCPNKCPAAVALLARLRPPKREPKLEITELPPQGDIGRGPVVAGSDNVEAAGDTQSEGQETGEEVRKGDEFILPSAREKHTV